MTKQTKITVMATALTLSAATALAQTRTTAGTSVPQDRKVFVSVNAGGQTQAHTFETGLSLPVYSQTAILNTSTGIDGGPIFDVNAEYRFMKYGGVGIGVGLGFSSFSVTGATTGAGSIPHPSFFNRHVAVTIPERGAKRNERSVYLTVAGSYRVTEEIEVTVYAGPSFFNVEQELITGFSVPAGTQDAVVSAEKQSKNTVGGIVGIDGSYYVTKNIGVGAFMRYNGASVDLPAAKNLEAGGFQLGAGVRIRY